LRSPAGLAIDLDPSPISQAGESLVEEYARQEASSRPTTGRAGALPEFDGPSGATPGSRAEGDCEALARGAETRALGARAEVGAAGAVRDLTALVAPPQATGPSHDALERIATPVVLASSSARCLIGRNPRRYATALIAAGDLVLLGRAAFLAGAIAGGGSLISFPLVSVGYPSITANVTTPSLSYPGIWRVARLSRRARREGRRIRGLAIVSVRGAGKRARCC
jgi:hypothetical protein